MNGANRRESLPGRSSNNREAARCEGWGSKGAFALVLREDSSSFLIKLIHKSFANQAIDDGIVGESFDGKSFFAHEF